MYQGVIPKRRTFVQCSIHLGQQVFPMVFWSCWLPKTLLPKTPRDVKMYKKSLKIIRLPGFMVQHVSTIVNICSSGFQGVCTNDSQLGR